MRSHATSTLQFAGSRTRREDLTVQVELSTVVASDYTNGTPKTNSAIGSITPDVKVSQEEVGSGSISNAGEDDQVLSPAMDKAERGALADLEARAGMDAPPRNSTRPIAFQLTSPITPRRQQQEEIAREQAEEDEFMRII